MGVYRNQSMHECPICNRKFFEDALAKHLKFCSNASLSKNPDKVEKYLQAER